MNKTPETFLDQNVPAIIPDTGVEHPNTDVEMTYLKNKNIDEAICQKLRKQYVYETNMHMIYNIFVGHTKNQLQEKAVLDATFQVVKKVRDPIG